MNFFCNSCFRAFDFNFWSPWFGSLVADIIQLNFVFQIVFVLYIYFHGLISHLLLLMYSQQNYVLESFWFIYFSFFQWHMQHKGIIGFPFFYFLRIMISYFQVFFFFSPPSFLYNFLLNRNVGLCFVAWILFVCCVELWGAWTWLGCCNSGCCGLLELDLDAAIQDAAGFVVWSWLELHNQFLYFYNIFICKCWTWICVSYSFSEFKHLHTQIFALWGTLGFNLFFFILLESTVGICCWN